MLETIQILRKLPYTSSFQNRSSAGDVPDVIYLDEQVHSGKYMVAKLPDATNNFVVTGGVFTITQDNADANTAMRRHFQIAAGNVIFTAQPWCFDAKEGDVRFTAHIINFAVQDALGMISSVTSEEVNDYRVKEHCATISNPLERHTAAISGFEKFRKHIYVFRN